MSYEPLHHKYRPKSFAELVGQEAIATTLTNAIRTAKIAPAYLFTGPRGTGKTSSARILAKSLNCLKSGNPTPEPCGVCEVCQGIAKGSTLDVIEIDAASNTGVDNIREIIERAQFAPVQCRYKVYVVDECHMLSTAAFNALLKTLEEPPKHVVFVLATTDPQRVLPTIISRCQRFDFRRIPLAAMVQHLSAIASKENISITADAITLIAQISQGGLRDAESLLDQLSLLAGEVTPERVWDLVGSVSERDLLTLAKAIADNDPEAVLDYTRKILDRGREPLIVLQNLAAFYRDLLIAKTAPNRGDLVACTQETWQALCQFATQLDITTILTGQQHLRATEVQIKNTTQPRLWLEVTILGLLPSAIITQGSAISYKTAPVSTNPQPPVQPTVTHPPISSFSPTTKEEKGDKERAIARTPPATGNGASTNGQREVSPLSSPITSSPPAPAPAYQPEPTVAEPTADTTLEDTWQKVLHHLQPMSTQALLRQMGHLIEFDGAVARIGMKSQAWCNKAKAYLPNITAAFQQAFQVDVKVSLELAKSSPPSTPANNNRAFEPPAPTYKSHVGPAPEVAKPAQEPQAKTEPKATDVVQTVSPPQAQTSTSVEWQEDEVAIAAQRLAKAFDGEIIRFTEELGQFAESSVTSEWGDEEEIMNDEL